MRNSFLILAVFSILFLSCKGNGKSYLDNKNIVDNHLSQKTDTIFFQNDSIIEFHRINNFSGVFKWGVVGKYENTGEDTIFFDETKSNRIKKVRDIFIFNDGCGTACDFVLVSKFSIGNKGTILMYPLFEDLRRGFILYKGDDDKILAFLFNLNTGKTIYIKGDFDRTIRPPKNVIDTVYLNKEGNIHIEWRKTNSSKGVKEIKF